TEAVVTVGTLAAPRNEDWLQRVREARARWGDWDFHAAEVDERADPEYIDWWVNFSRLAASPAAAAHYTRMSYETDISDVLAAVHVPVLVLHERVGDSGWELAQQLPKASIATCPNWSSPCLMP